MRTSKLFGTKNFEFLKFMVCPPDKEGWASADKGRGVNFSRTSFMNGSLLNLCLECSLAQFLIYCPNNKRLLLLLVLPDPFRGMLDQLNQVNW